MENSNRNFKNEIKDWWDANKDKIKIGAACLAGGLFVGFVKGVLTQAKMQDRTYSELIKKIPYEPDYDDIGEYVHDHIDELKDYIKEEIEFNE